MAAPTQPVDENKSITIILNVEKPEIILVEQMDDINCNALIFNTELSMRFRMVGERQVIKSEISQFYMYMSEFNPSRRELTKNYVIHPCSLSLNGSTPEGKGLHISLNVTDIKICVTPAIIELLNKAMITLTSQDKKTEVAKIPPNYSNIWEPQDYKESDFWFFNNTEVVAEDALQTMLAIDQTKSELCIAEVPSIIIIVETGSGYQTIPMLIIETNMQANVNNWSSQMSIESSLHLSMSYYNSTLALWEPLIEPNQRENPNGIIEYGPWEMSFSLDIVKDEDDEESEPKTQICISSKDILELTVTKTCLDVLQNLGSAFSEAIKSEGLTKPSIDAPYIVQNDTGFDITLNLVDSAFLLHDSHLPNSGYILDEKISKAIVFESHKSNSDVVANDVTFVTISAGGKAYLQLKDKNKTTLTKNVNVLTGKAADERFLHVKIGDIDKELVLPVHKADERYFPLYRDTKQEPWGIVSDISVEYGCTIINVHGVLQVENHFSTPITVYRVKDGVAHNVGDVQPNTIFNVPLHAIYASEKEIHFSLPGYKMSVHGISWKENPSDYKYTRTIQCDPISTFEPFYLNVSLYYIINSFAKYL